MVWYRGTGVGNYTQQLIANLQALPGDEQYRILWADNEEPPPLPERWRAFPMPRQHQADLPLIERWLRDEAIDIYHVPQNGMRVPDDLGATRLVVTVHDLIPFVMPETVNASFRRRFQREVTAALEAAWRVIAVSRHTARDLTSVLSVPPERIRVVHPAHQDFFRPVSPATAYGILQARYGVEPPFLVYVGGLNPRKGLFDLLYAYSKVCRGLDSGQQLVIAGESVRHLPAIQAMGQAIGIVPYLRLAGHIEQADLPALYSAADFAVYPSLYEGFGLPPLEAMACGTAVITTETSSIPEVTGSAAIRVGPGDVTGLAGAIKMLAGDEGLRRRLAAAGLRRARRFSWAKAAGQIRSIYLEDTSQEDNASR